MCSHTVSLTMSLTRLSVTGSSVSSRGRSHENLSFRKNIPSVSPVEMRCCVHYFIIIVINSARGFLVIIAWRLRTGFSQPLLVTPLVNLSRRLHASIQKERWRSSAHHMLDYIERSHKSIVASEVLSSASVRRSGSSCCSRGVRA
jgi:hypothetical protein